MTTCILIIPNNKFISGSEERTIKLWDLNSFECLNTVTNGLRFSTFCLISNNQIACGCGNGSISIWDLNNLSMLKLFKAHHDTIKCLKFFDQSKLISCSNRNDKLIKIWSLETFECIKVINGDWYRINYIDFTSDGNLFSCSKDGTIKVWQLETGKMLKSIDLKRVVSCVKLLNDDLIAVGLENGDLLIYDLKTNKTLHCLYSCNREEARWHSVNCIYFLSNGNLLHGCRSGGIRLFKLFDKYSDNININ